MKLLVFKLFIILSVSSCGSSDSSVGDVGSDLHTHRSYVEVSSERVYRASHRNAACRLASRSIRAAADQAVYFTLFPNSDVRRYGDFQKRNYTVHRAKKRLQKAKRGLKKIGLDVDVLQGLGVDLAPWLALTSGDDAEIYEMVLRTRVIQTSISARKDFHIVRDEFVDSFVETAERNLSKKGISYKIRWPRDALYYRSKPMKYAVKAAVEDFLRQGHGVEGIFNPEYIEAFKKYLYVEQAAYKQQYKVLDDYDHLDGSLREALLKNPAGLFKIANSFEGPRPFPYLRRIVSSVYENRAALKAAHKVFVEAGAGSCGWVVDLIRL